jgi:hypothetical protein
MPYARAIEILGVTPNASPSEIRAAFAEKVKDAHPDINPEAGPADLADLTEARAVASTGPPGTDLVPVVRDLMQRQERNLERAEGRRLAERAVSDAIRTLTRYQTRHVVGLKRRAQQASAAATGLGIVSGGVRALLQVMPATRAEQDGVLISTLLFGTVAVLLAGFGWVVGQRVQRAEQAIEDAADALGDRGRYLAILTEIEERSGVSAPWNAEVLPMAIEAWVEGAPEQGYASQDTVVALARRVGPSEFVRLFTAKGAELGLLKEHIVDVAGRPSVQYELDFGN